MLALYGDHIRYCIEMKRGLVWDGCRWAVDDRGMTNQLVKRMARKITAQAKAAIMTIGRDEFEAWQKFALKSEAHKAILAALETTATERGIPVSAKELDQNPYLLNCPNGMIDLGTKDLTKQLLPHDRGMMITKLCHVEFDPNARCDQFQTFLHWAMGDNPDAEVNTRTQRLCAFLQRAFGYALTADVSEKSVFVLWGEKGNNGKTTLVTAFKAILNEYADEISIDTLMSTKTQDATLAPTWRICAARDLSLRQRSKRSIGSARGN